MAHPQFPLSLFKRYREVILFLQLRIISNMVCNRLKLCNSGALRLSPRNSPKAYLTTSHNKQLTRTDRADQNDHTWIGDWWTDWLSDWLTTRTEAHTTNRRVIYKQLKQKKQSKQPEIQPPQETRIKRKTKKIRKILVYFYTPKKRECSKEKEGKGERKGQILTKRRVNKTAWSPEPHPRKKQQWEKQRAKVKKRTKTTIHSRSIL